MGCKRSGVTLSDRIAVSWAATQDRGLSVNRMLQNVPETWDEQRRLWEFPAPTY